VNDQRVAIVTAASSGIGAACARELAARGYSVVLMSRSKAVRRIADEIGGAAILGSVTSLQDLRALVDYTVNTHGRIDALVNNTGHPARGALLDVSDQQWHDGLDLLLLNVVRAARFVTPVMIRQGGGSIVNISAFGAVEPSLDYPVSSSIRAALSNFTKLFADQYAESNIRMNNVLPGWIDSYAVEAEVARSIPMRRAGGVAEVAKTVAMLLSEETAYVTGQNIRVDGGLTRSPS
jgi:NAD(P)-dependent dehydrogenase (short-subunit alcohol dehydrogenase family)